MQIKTKHLLTMLAVAGISLTALPATAATTYAAGDILIGFRATGGTGSTTSLVVNIGNSQTIRDNNTTNSVLANIGAALASAYGSGWESRTDLFWGAAGVGQKFTTDPVANGDPGQTLYLTRAGGAGNVGMQNTANPTTSGTTGHTGVVNKVYDWETAFQGFTGTTANGGLVAFMDTSLVNTYDEFTGTTSDWTSSFNTDAAVTGGSVLDLYRILGTTTGANPTGTARTGAWQGTLSLGTDGTISFNPGLVPEPSRTLLAATGLGFLFMRRRRRA